MFRRVGGSSQDKFFSSAVLSVPNMKQYKCGTYLCSFKTTEGGSSSRTDVGTLNKGNPLVLFGKLGHKEWGSQRSCTGRAQADLQLLEQQWGGQADCAGHPAGMRCFLSGK